MLAKLYRKIFPASLRDLIYKKFLGKLMHFLRHFNIHLKSKFVFLFQWLLPKTEENKALAFIGCHGLTSYPYPYMLEYKNFNVDVKFDDSIQLPYVIHNNKKLYFPAKMEKEEVFKIYKSLVLEQDSRAAHRYVVNYDELKNKTLLDIGSAEGIFSLDTIENLKHLYLFECEEYWIKPLQATFAPWKEKVTFVKKYVSNAVSEIEITIDEFFKDKEKDNLFFKMDIEGFELKALEGAKDTLRHGKNNQLALCTYHRIGDPEKISKFVSDLGYQYTFSVGLMYWNKRFSKGVIRCKN